MTFFKRAILFVLVLIFALSCKTNNLPGVGDFNGWEALVDDDLSQWDVFMGVPHKASGIKGYEDIEDVRFGTPLGLNQDPKNVFSVIEDEGEKVIKITGEIFAGLVTKREFENYHMKFQFKWGEKKWEPRLDKKRNSGILYHSVGDHRDFWNVWMSSLEFEVQETDCGDFITISQDGVKAMSPAVKKEDGEYYFAPGGELIEMSWRKEVNVTGRNWKNGDPEFPHGQWNTLELICFGDQAIHIVNGVVVMSVHQPMYHNGTDWVAMNKGKIQLQSEAAEIYYKNIGIKFIQDFPEQYQQYMR